MNLYKIILVGGIMLLYACSSNPKNESIAASDINLKDLGQDILDEDSIIDHLGESVTRVTSSSNTIPMSRGDLERMQTFMYMQNGEKNYGAKIPGFSGLRLGKKESSLSTYYLESKVVNDSIIYGCGYSVHYLFKRVKRGIDISDLSNVSASVQLNNKKTKVLYSFQTYGIISRNLTQYFKPIINKKFDVEGFGHIKSSIDGIHAVLGDSVLSRSVKFMPEIIEFIKPYSSEGLK